MLKTHHRWALLGAGAALTLASVHWWCGRGTEPAGPVVSSTAVNAAPSLEAQAPPVVGVPAPQTSIADVADPMSALAISSLRDTEVDGWVVLDVRGAVQPDRALRRLFDYWLTLVGEHDVATIRALFAQWLGGRHGAAATQRVLDVFDRYVAYLAAVAKAEQGASSDTAARLRQLRELRAHWLGEPLASAFFADEQVLDDYTLARLAVAADTTLDAAGRADRLRELESRLPPAPREARAESDAAQWVEVHEQTLRERGVDAAEVYAERRALWGDAAAGRLAELDRAQAAWDARVASYVRARDALPATDLAAREALKLQWFDAAERRRVDSLEAIGQLPDG